jgi:hypothetical protein
MNFFKNRGVAAAISALLMIVSLLIGVHKSAQGASDKIENLFYQGTNSTGSDNTVAIYDQLERRADAALGIATIADNYDGLSDASQEVRQNRQELISCQSISDLFVINQALERSTQQLVELCNAQQLNERDKSGLETYLQRFEGAQTLIEQNSYNEKVSEFKSDVLNKFPLSALKAIAGVKAPEMFS